MEKNMLKAIEYMAMHFRTYGGADLSRQVHEILYPKGESEFMECDACRSKAGSPTLCEGCLHNRAAIEKLAAPKTL